MQRFLYEQDYNRMVVSSANRLDEEIRELEGKLESNGFIYRNKPFQLFPRVVILSSSDREKIRNDAEKLLAILEKVIRIYEEDVATREFFMLDEAASRLVQIDPGYERKIRISRFDTYLVPGEESFKVLENNTDCPAGTIFTGRINTVIRQIPSISTFLKNIPPLFEEGIHKSDTFINELISTFAEFSFGSPLRSMAILQLDNHVSLEVKEMLKLLQQLGIEAVVTDPRQLSYQDGKLYAGNQRIELIWNKINSADFIPLLNDSDALSDFICACENLSVCHVNSFQARFITESKLCMAYLSDPSFRKHFTEEECKLLDKHIPWARKLSDVPSENNDDQALRKLFKLNRKNLVLKTAYDIRGEGVVIGLSTSQEKWEELVDQCWDKPYIMQELIAAPEIPVPAGQGSSLTHKKFSADLFMFGGKFQGFGSKLSDELKVNVFQGGSKQAIFSIDDGAVKTSDTKRTDCKYCGNCTNDSERCS
ncbi:circularly permuted type 2 ATP-grasp protein [Paenibacillus amylolyticus]|uniref:circularly permuted type 2 ATP-grasp protein n=1 Tax=Paenibacillus amylolyticus TaxID=1451 RepID=UPI003EBFDF03